MQRREFLKKSGFITMSVAAFGLSACSLGRKFADLKFPQGIASADPRPDSIVLWVRAVLKTDDDIFTSTTGDLILELRVTSADNAARIGQTEALGGNNMAVIPLTAQQAYDHTVRHKLSGLSAATTYYYQFSAGNSRSPIGRFRTAPALDSQPRPLRFAVLACQNWSINHWGTLTDLVTSEPDLDFFLHLGDYVYEKVDAGLQDSAVEARHTALMLPDGIRDNEGATYAMTVNDYRYLYKRYRSDVRLQAVHARYAVIAVWDDHEFSDDCWKDAETYDNGTYDLKTSAGDNIHQTARRRSANRAWFEHMPADVTLDESTGSFDTIRLYRDFRFGNLAHLVMTDQRLYRADHLIPEAAPNPVTGEAIGPIGSRYMAMESLLYDQIEAAKIALGTQLGDPLALVSMLGATQRAWWKDTLRTSTARWKLWGSEVMLLKQGLDGTKAIATLLALQAVPTLGAQTAFGVMLPDIIANGVNSVYVPTDKKAALAPYFAKFVFDADAWDGYDAERRALMSHLQTHAIGNVVALTGDIHAFYAGEVRDNYRAANGGNTVMNELVVAGVSSRSNFSSLKNKVGSFASELATLVYYPINGIVVTGVGTIDIAVNLIDYTLGRSAPTLDDLKAQVRHPVRTALAAKGMPETQLDAATTAVIEQMSKDSRFNTTLLNVAQMLAGLNNNPRLKHVDTDAQGYAVVQVTADRLQCSFRKINRLLGSRSPTAPSSLRFSTVTATIVSGSTHVTLASGDIAKGG